jgi:MFS family permease
MSKGGIFHPSRGLFRFTILGLVSLLPFGSYFAYDSLGAITPTLVKALGVDRGDVGATYTIYSVAAILSVLMGGFLFDRIGPRLASLLFMILVLVGTLIVALAPHVAPRPAVMPVIYVGRFIFGAGSESLVVAQSAILARWFKGKELALSFGIALTVCRLGTLFSFNTEELIAGYFGSYEWALWAAVLFVMVSLGANLLYNMLDRHGERVLELEKGEASERIVLSDVARFGAPFWFVTLLCVTFYSAIFPFTALATDFFHEKWHMPTTSHATGGFIEQALGNYLHMFSTAGGTTSIIIFASMVFAPFAGGLVDRVGKRATLMIIGSVAMIPCYLVMGFTNLPPQAAMIVLGAAFVLVPAAMWPAVPLVVDRKATGTAFGLMTMIQNVGLALFPWLNGKLRDVTQNYAASMVMFACLGLVGLACAVGLLVSDRRLGGTLQKAAKAI